MGRSAAMSIFAAFFNSALPISGCESGSAGGRRPTISDLPKSSQHISTETGPGRPEVATRTASLTISGASAGLSIRTAHLMSEFKVAS